MSTKIGECYWETLDKLLNNSSMNYDAASRVALDRALFEEKHDGWYCRDLRVEELDPSAELCDLIVHVSRQGLGGEINVVRCWEAARCQWTKTFGSNKAYLGTPDYVLREQQKHEFVWNQCWDIVESKIKYDKI